MRRFYAALRMMPLALAPALVASADFDRPLPGEVALRTAPGKHGDEQEARTIIDAPIDAVRRWLTAYEYWPGRFRDILEVRVLEHDGIRARIWVRSRIMRELVLDIERTPRGIAYEANASNVHARGRIELSALPDGRTDVVMGTSAELSGLLGAITPDAVLRSRERQKLASDLTDLHRLARARRASPSPTRPAERAGAP